MHTLGCRLNQYETDRIRDRLVAAGYTIVPHGEPTNLAVINTCTVTHQADAKCRAEIRKFIRRQPQARVAVVGCYAQMGHRALARIPGIDLILGNQDKLNLLDYLPPEKTEVPVVVRERIDKTDFTVGTVGELPFDQRANLKIQDGCDFHCAFCIIPQARGHARARAFADLMAEARNLVDRGVREIVISGVNIGTYNQAGRDIVAVVDALDALPGLYRVRISSIEPTTIPLALFDRMAAPDHTLQPFLHIPLQSGSDPVLRHMRRKYTLKAFTDFIAEADRRVPDLCIGTDILVGYPIETEARFAETCETFRAHPFAYCHVFTFSERKGTPAAAIPADRQVPVAVRHQRSAHLRRLSARKRHAFACRFLGRDRDVLFENSRDGVWPGYTDNYIRVLVDDPGRGPLVNRRGVVRLKEAHADFVEGELVRLVD
ncbi:MAG: tRNA (N(6)-L-threonylcarbamoyladenosine(37)-C(2))-methylthiotransferase MtaB [Opitutales bacterium]